MLILFETDRLASVHRGYPVKHYVCETEQIQNYTPNLKVGDVVSVNYSSKKGKGKPTLLEGKIVSLTNALPPKEQRVEPASMFVYLLISRYIIN